MDNLKKLRNKIEKRRLLLGYSVSDVSRLSGVSRTQYTDIRDNDEYKFTARTLMLITRALGMTVSASSHKLVYCKKCLCLYSSEATEKDGCPKCKTDSGILPVLSDKS